LVNPFESLFKLVGNEKNEESLSANIFSDHCIKFYCLSCRRLWLSLLKKSNRSHQLLSFVCI